MSIPIRTASLSAILGTCLYLAGCVSQKPEAPHSASQHVAPESTTQAVPVIRSHRYTLISIKPTVDQRDLLQQIVDIRIPDHLAPTVQDAMAYTLRRSGYRLCPDTEAVVGLYALPLPAAHYRLGPLPLRDALQVLAGQAWKVQVDERSREVCFELRPEFQPGVA